MFMESTELVYSCIGEKLFDFDTQNLNIQQVEIFRFLLLPFNISHLYKGDGTILNNVFLQIRLLTNLSF